MSNKLKPISDLAATPIYLLSSPPLSRPYWPHFYGPDLNVSTLATLRNFATVASTTPRHKVVVIGGGSAGIAISRQLLRKWWFRKNDIAVVDPAKWHHYQPGWTLVGAGLKKKEDLRSNLSGLIPRGLKFYNNAVKTIMPEQNRIVLGEDGSAIDYEHLVIAPGITVDQGSVKGLPEAVENPGMPVSTIYDYNYCDKTFQQIKEFKQGYALFNHPSGVIKCAGAPQKIMWLALDYWKTAGLYKPHDPQSPIKITFATGMPSMFAVPKYNATLEALRISKGVSGLFSHDLLTIDGHTATFSNLGRPSDPPVNQIFDFLHVTPKHKPHAFIAASPSIANEAGYVEVHKQTLQHARYENIWSLGDASSLPTSKTVAAITAQVPVLVANIKWVRDRYLPRASYDGYASCPLPVGDGKVLLAEFKYGDVPKETFGRFLGPLR